MLPNTIPKFIDLLIIMVYILTKCYLWYFSPLHVTDTVVPLSHRTRYPQRTACLCTWRRTTHSSPGVLLQFTLKQVRNTVRAYSIEYFQLSLLTYQGMDGIEGILKTTFANKFSWIQMLVFWLIEINFVPLLMINITQAIVQWLISPAIVLSLLLSMWRWTCMSGYQYLPPGLILLVSPMSFRNI